MSLTLPSLLKLGRKRVTARPAIEPWTNLIVGLDPSAAAHIRALREAGIGISDAAIYKLYAQEKDFPQEPMQVTLAICTPKSLEWSPWWSYADVVARAGEWGALPCIPGVAPELVKKKWMYKKNDSVTITEPPEFGSTLAPTVFQLQQVGDNEPRLNILTSLTLWDYSALVFMIPQPSIE